MTERTAALTHAYPFASPGECFEFPPRPGIGARLGILWRDLRLRSFARRSDDISIRRINGAPRALRATDIALVCALRNTRRYVASFLDHYRDLGVSRFLMVDDASDDGTRELLAGEADVDLYESNVRFRTARGGRVWRDMLMSLHGRDRWYVSVDADEFLVYPGSETRTVSAFIQDLERHGLRRSLAPMLDLYPPGRLADGRFDASVHRRPYHVSTHFDGTGYTIASGKSGVAITGGPRQRLFGVENQLAKFPVTFADGSTQESATSAHRPLPLMRNFAPVTSVLLHYKFSSESVSEFGGFVAGNQHATDSREYRAIVASDAFRDDLSLVYPGSVRYVSSDDLVARGFMADLRDQVAK